MTKQQLIAKRVLYEAKKVEIETETYEEAINKEVEEYKTIVSKKYADIKAADTAKVNNYLDLLNELIAEAETLETETEQASV